MIGVDAVIMIGDYLQTINIKMEEVSLEVLLDRS
jgi:hypothetical protein